MTACEPETFTSLVTSLAHWELEVFIMVVVDGLALGLAWPFIRKHWKHHVAHDQAHPETAHAPDGADWGLPHGYSLLLRGEGKSGHANDPVARPLRLCRCSNIVGVHDRRITCQSSILEVDIARALGVARREGP